MSRSSQSPSQTRIPASSADILAAARSRASPEVVTGSRTHVSRSRKRTRENSSSNDVFSHDSNHLPSASSSSRPPGELDASETESAPARMSPQQRMDHVLAVLQKGRLSPFDLLLTILDPDEPSYEGYRRKFYAEDGKFPAFMDLLRKDVRGAECLASWLQPHAQEVVSRVVYKEMDEVKVTQRLNLSEVTPDSLRTWNLSDTFDKINSEDAPCLTAVLRCAAQTRQAAEKNKIKNDPSKLVNVVVSQLAHYRSHHSMAFQAGFSLFLWSSGASRETLDALHHCGLSISYNSLLQLIEQLAELCVKQAGVIAREPHMHGYDNVNLCMSSFIEQRDGAPAKVQSGTTSIIYPLRNATRAAVALEPILQRSRIAGGLLFSDVCPSDEQQESSTHQILIHIVRALTTFVSDFADYTSMPELQHVPRRAMPPNHKTEQYPLRTTTIDESTVDGNIAVLDNMYHQQLKMTYDELSNIAVPSINDQSTNARIRGAKILRAGDDNPFTRIENFQVGFGLFHMSMNLIWALLHIHRSSLQQEGSLTYFFALLGRVRLGAEHPDYHTLLAALMQILNGILLNWWRAKCGFLSLKAFAQSAPSPQELLSHARDIMESLGAAADDSEEISDTSESESESENDSGSENSQANSTTGGDTISRNAKLLVRDLLYVAELNQAVRDGDWGRIEDILGALAMVFRGAGSNNYCTEILHFLHNLKHVWTPEFADVMRDNMIINTSGRVGHACGVDHNIERHVKFQKTTHLRHGLYGSWDRLGDISALAALVQAVKKRVAIVLDAQHRGMTHTDPDTSSSVWKVADKSRELQLHGIVPGRDSTSITNILAFGEKRMKSSTLKTFNKKIEEIQAGQISATLPDADEHPPMDFKLDTVEEEEGLLQ